MDEGYRHRPAVNRVPLRSDGNLNGSARNQQGVSSEVDDDVPVPVGLGRITKGNTVNSNEKDIAMKLASQSGMSIAIAAATLILSGAALAPVSHAEEAKGYCVGANACKGQSACKSAANACKGQNACKGKGFLSMTKADTTSAMALIFQQQWASCRTLEPVRQVRC
jgi:hypothetical protein